MIDSLRVSEVYTSIQGEGPNVGTPTQFVRFAGCNLRCPGWPCDTPHAINPAIWRKEAKLWTPGELLGNLADWPRALTFTGGEPFLQQDDLMDEFITLCIQSGYTIEVFTNGTFAFPIFGPAINYILDWKLPGSGDRLMSRHQDNRMSNVEQLDCNDVIKFTVVSRADLVDAHIWLDRLRPRTQAQFFVGGVWDKITDKEIVKFTLDHRATWKLNVQLHKHIWPADERGV